MFTPSIGVPPFTFLGRRQGGADAQALALIEINYRHILSARGGAGAGQAGAERRALLIPARLGYNAPGGPIPNFRPPRSQKT